MKNYHFFSACCLLFIASVLSFTACNSDPSSSSCPKKPVHLVLFTDVEVSNMEEYGGSIIGVNNDRFNTLFRPIENTFLNTDNLYPISINYYPIYYNTLEGEPRATFFSAVEHSWCDLSESDIDKLDESYRIRAQFQSFIERKVINENRSYRQAWPIIKIIEQEVENLDSQDSIPIVFIIHSHMLERWRKKTSTDGVYDFTDSFDGQGTGRYRLDCNVIRAVLGSLSSSAQQNNRDSVLLTSLEKCNNAIEAFKTSHTGVPIKTLVIHADAPPDVASNSCGENLLKEYTKALLTKAGLSPKFITPDQLEAELIKLR